MSCPRAPPTSTRNGVWPGQLSADGGSAECALKSSDPDLVNDHTIIVFMLVNLLAGADTTAITLRAIFYYVLRTPRVHATLVAEFDAANMSEPIAYRQTEKLPYFNAVVREAMRLHSGVGAILERVVPATGLTLPDGSVVPPGTIVGSNPWVTARDSKVSGKDAESSVPERWLKGEGESQSEFDARVKKIRMRTSPVEPGIGRVRAVGWL